MDILIYIAMALIAVYCWKHNWFICSPDQEREAGIKQNEYKNLYKNWAVHNLIGHPLMEVLTWFGAKQLAKKVHDGTLPSGALD